MVNGFYTRDKSLTETLENFGYMYRYAKNIESPEVMANMQLNIAGAYEVHQNFKLAKIYTDSAAQYLAESDDLLLRSWAFERKA